MIKHAPGPEPKLRPSRTDFEAVKRLQRLSAEAGCVLKERIKEWRPHWSILHKSHAEDAALYGSEAEKWKHNPILHPLRYLRDPYYLEEKHYKDRPYPASSPAFTNVPLVGPILAATIGRVVKPTVRMHEKEWDGTKYTLYSPRLEPRGPDALPPPLPKDEYSLGNVFGKEVRHPHAGSTLYRSKGLSGN